MDTPSICAPAMVRCPPPPSFSIITCTFTSSIERALKKMVSFTCVMTKDALIPMILSSSLAAWAPMTVGLSSPSDGHSEMANSFSKISALLTASALAR